MFEGPLLVPFMLLSVVGGYFFITNYSGTAPFASRREGNHLYLSSAGWGTLIGVVSFFVTGLVIFAINFATEPLRCAVLSERLAHETFLSWDRLVFPTAFWEFLIGLFSITIELLRHISKCQAALVGPRTELIFLASMLYSPFAGWEIAKIANRFANTGGAFNRAIHQDEFELKLIEAMSSEKLVMASFEDRKVYVGFAVSNANSELPPRRYFELLPVMSGYRDKLGKVKFTTFYVDVFETENDSGPFDPELFTTVFPLSRLTSFRLFDMDAYAAFNPSTASGASPKGG